MISHYHALIGWRGFDDIARRYCSKCHASKDSQ